MQHGDLKILMTPQHTEARNHFELKQEIIFHKKKRGTLTELLELT